MYTIWHEYTDNPDIDVSKSTFSFQGKQSSDVERINHLQNIHDVQILPLETKGPFSILSQVELVKERMLNWHKSETSPELESKKQESMSVARMFGLDVGGGMKKYRQAFILDLKKKGEEGDKLWSVVNNAVRLCERDNNIPSTIEKQFPDTLEKALKYYSVERQ